MTPFATELLDAMAIEQVANLHEVKSAFPDCVAVYCGHPIVLEICNTIRHTVIKWKNYDAACTSTSAQAMQLLQHAGKIQR